MEFREAREDEYAAVGQLTRLAYEHAGYFENPQEPYLDELADVPARAPHSTIWVGVEDGVIRAAAALVTHGSEFADVAQAGELEFRMLAVDPLSQGQGLGARTVKSIMDRARSMEGISSVVLTSGEQMKQAHRLYTALGFKRVPERDWTIFDGAVHLWVFQIDLD